MKNIAIYGAGGFGREVACLISEINKIKKHWNFIGFFDDGNLPKESSRFGPLLGGIDSLNNWQSELSLTCSIANPKTRCNVISQVNNSLINFPNLIAPTVHYYDLKSVDIGIGNIIFNGCRLSCDINIGNFNLLNGYVAFGHDVIIGDFNVFGPSSRISGFVNVGNSNLFGVNSVVLQGITVGSNITLGAGSVLMKSELGPGLIHGNPARKINE